MLTILVKGKKEGTPTGFLTNDDGNVFPVFGGKYQPKNLERHREIVQKIHDNTTDPAKKAKHAEYLASLDGRGKQEEGKPAPSEMSDSDKRLHDLVAKHEMAYGLGTGRTPSQRLEYLRDEQRRAAEIHRRHVTDAERPKWSEPTAADKKRVEDAREAAKLAERIADIADKRLAHRRENPNATFVAPTLPHGDYDVTDKDKIALSFSKADFDDLEPDLKERLRRFYNWSPKSSSWISKARSSDDNAHRIAVEAGFSRPEKKDIKQIERKLPEAKPVEGLGEGEWHKASAEDVNPKTALAAYQNTSWTPEERAAREGGNHVEAMNYAVSQLERLASTPEKQALLKSMLEDYRPKLLEKHHAYLASRSRLASSAITGPSNFPVQQMERRGEIVHNKLGDYLQFQDDSINRMRKILTSDLDGGPIMSHHADAIPRLQEKLAKAEKYQESAKALNKIAKSSKMSDEEKIAKIVSDLGFSEDTARKALTPDAFGNIGVAAYSLTNNNANIRRIKEQIADIQKRYNLEKGEGVTMRLFMLKGGKAKGSPTGFLTNEEGNVFPVFGGNYRPKNLEKHREIVQKIHDNTKDPEKRAKHAEYLKSLGGGAEQPAPGEPDISKLSPWKKGDFEIQKAASRAEGAKQFKESVSGWTSKHFGIHKAPQGRKDAKPYTLTHLHTGTAIGVRSGTLEAAQAYASALEYHGGNAWAFTDSREPPAARSDYEKWFKDAETTSDSIRDQRNASRIEKARQNYREVGDKIATSDVKVSHGGKSVWDKERASEVITAGGRFVTDGSMMILEPTSSVGANPMNITEKDLRPFWDDTINAATSRNEAKLDEESLYDKSETFAKHGRERIPFAQLRDDSEAYPVNVAKIRWIQKRTGATSMRMVPHGDHARIVLYQGSRPVAIAMSRRKSDDMKKGRNMVLRMLKGEGKRQPSGFITVGGGEEKGGHVIPVFGHAPSDYEGKITVTTAGGKEYDIDEDKHEAIKAKIKRHQAEAAGQGKLFSERGKPTEKAKEAGSREAPPKKEPASKPEPAKQAAPKEESKPTPQEPAKPEPSPEDAIKAKVDAKLAEVAERSKALGEKFKAERAEKAKKEADAASPEEINAYLEKATDAYLKSRPLEKEKVEAFKAKQSSTPAKEQGSGDEPWGRPYKDRLVGDVYKEKQALRDMMNADNMTQQQMRDFQNIGVRLEGQYDKRSFDEAVTADREAMRQLRARLTGSGKGDAGSVTVKPAGPKKEVEAKQAESAPSKETPLHTKTLKQHVNDVVAAKSAKYPGRGPAFDGQVKIWKQTAEKAWKDAVMEEATKNRLPNATLKSWADAYGEESIPNTFRGKYERGAGGHPGGDPYEPTGVRKKNDEERAARVADRKGDSKPTIQERIDATKKKVEGAKTSAPKEAQPYKPVSTKPDVLSNNAPVSYEERQKAIGDWRKSLEARANAVMAGYHHLPEGVQSKLTALPEPTTSSIRNKAPDLLDDVEKMIQAREEARSSATPEAMKQAKEARVQQIRESERARKADEKASREENFPSKWTPGSFDVATANGKRGVDGFRRGAFGYHKSGDGYTVTHVPTGMAIHTAKGPTIAKRFINDIHKHEGLDWTSSNPDVYRRDHGAVIKRIKAEHAAGDAAVDAAVSAPTGQERSRNTSTPRKQK